MAWLIRWGTEARGPQEEDAIGSQPVVHSSVKALAEPSQQVAPELSPEVTASGKPRLAQWQETHGKVRK
jgi:hypothetical protein